MAWIKYNEDCVINSDRILDIWITSEVANSKGNHLEWVINFRDCRGCQFAIETFNSKEECEKYFNYIIELIDTKSYIDLTNAKQNRIPMNEEYLLSKGFLKEVDEKLALEGFVTPNERIIVGSHRPYKTFPYDWFVIVKDQSLNGDIGSLDFAYVDQFETFLKICGVDYGEKQ